MQFLKVNLPLHAHARTEEDPRRPRGHSCQSQFFSSISGHQHREFSLDWLEDRECKGWFKEEK